MTATLSGSRNPQAQNAIHLDSTRELSRAATREVSWSESPNSAAAQPNSHSRITSITASVRVLTVGCHQMTLGMLKQLDIVSAADIEPVGRVRTRPQGGSSIELVGVTAEGVLAAAVVRPPSWSGSGSLDLDHFAQHAHPEWVGRNVSVGSDRGRRLVWQVDVFSHPTNNSLKSRIRCGVKYLEEQWREEAAQELAEVIEAQNAYDLAKRLPLLLVPGVR
jgi:hypothetical protein